MMTAASVFTIEFPWLLCLLPLPFIVFKLLPPVAEKKSSALKVPFFSVLTTIVQRSSQMKIVSLKHLWLPVLIWLLLVFAASNPLWLGAPIAIEQSGRDLLMALDISPSMANSDMVTNSNQVTRLAVVKEAATKFIDGRSGDRLGLIVFGEQAYLLTPLTNDHQTLKDMLNDATAGLAGNSTAIGDAIGLGIKRLLPFPAKSRVLILLTDGANNAGNVDPIAAAKEAAKFGIKIYTVGLGANEMQVQDFFGVHGVNPSADLDEATLQNIASITGGEYFRATDNQSLKSALQQMSKLEPIINDKVTYRPKTTLYPWILILAALLFLGTSVQADWRGLRQ